MQMYQSYFKFLCTHRQKKLLVSSSEYGKDLYGVQRHLKNHQHLENELDTHESTLHVISLYLIRSRNCDYLRCCLSTKVFVLFQSIISHGNELISSDHYAGLEIRKQCMQLEQQWKELTDLSSSRSVSNSQTVVGYSI